MEKTLLYDEVCARLRALLAGERDLVANAANTAAVLFDMLPEVNWAGFYFTRAEPATQKDLQTSAHGARILRRKTPKAGGLVLGPFQGRPACVRIALGRGVCGTAAERRRPVVVPDVHAFEGHIACDAASRAEIVVPILSGGRLLGVLDLDSPRPGRFDAEDQAGLERVVAVFVDATDL